MYIPTRCAHLEAREAGFLVSNNKKTARGLELFLKHLKGTFSNAFIHELSLSQLFN